MSRDGPGLLLRDILSGKAGDVERGLKVIDRVDPDILLLTNFDYDLDLGAARAFSDRLARPYPYIFAFRPNAGMDSGVDLDGDGRLGRAGDAVGYGKFSGNGGMVLLSRFPIDDRAAIDLTGMKWADLPGNRMTVQERATFGDSLPLSSIGHWIVPVRTGPDAVLTLLLWHAGTPAFGGPDGWNTRRNADENAIWLHLLDGALPVAPPTGDYVLIGTANLDPFDGQGDHAVIGELLAHPALKDPEPTSAGAVIAAREQGADNDRHRGDPTHDTADWRDQGGPGNLRVQYILPAATLDVVTAGVFWPGPDDPDARLLAGRDASVSWHGLVWTDIGR